MAVANPPDTRSGLSAILSFLYGGPPHHHNLVSTFVHNQKPDLCGRRDDRRDPFAPRVGLSLLMAPRGGDNRLRKSYSARSLSI